MPFSDFPLSDLLERVAVLETKTEDIEKSVPESVASLRVELIGHDSKGGIIGYLTQSIEDDLKDHRAAVAEVDVRATKADKFVRRVITWAAGAVGGSIVAAVLLIYSAGEHAASAKADTAASRAEMVHKIDTLEQSLTELRSQVSLMLEARIKP